MSFLNPAAIAIAAGLTIPPLVALYFLKLKRDVKPVPSTLLWKQSVEDLQVNSPFQRLRSSLLLLLQLLVLIAAAVALGKPMFETTDVHDSTLILLIDQSASMGVMEQDGMSRLEKAKEQAKIRIENMHDNARAMIIAFCDRAIVVSSFDSDKRALVRKIDSIEQTESRSALSEAIKLAEANMQNMFISQADGTDKEIRPNVESATVIVFSDGRIEDTDRVSIQRLDVDKLQLVSIGQRGDNVGIVAMAARRNYEFPEVLEVTATVENFQDQPITLDAVLHVDGRVLDVQTLDLAASPPPSAPEDATSRERIGDHRRVVAFDQIEFGGSGIVEVVLRVDDALSADDKAWTVIQSPRHLRVLLVTEGNLFLENALSTLPIDVVRLTGSEYDEADDSIITDGNRSTYDVVVFDRHATARLPQGNYFFFGTVPQLDGISTGKTISDQVIFNWDDTHPILRHVALETLQVYEWEELIVPPNAVSIIDGETSPVLTYLTRDASQFLISAFPLIAQDDDGNLLMNTHWVTSVDFVVFMQNAVQYLAGNLATTGRDSVAPGEPVMLPAPANVDSVSIHRPDGVVDAVSVAGFQTLHYAQTRQVGTYRLEPAVAGHEFFPINLFNPVESMVKPVSQLSLGAGSVESTAASVKVNEPAWSYLLLAALALLLLEWIVYNQRVFV